MTDYQNLPASHNNVTETHSDLVEVRAKSDKLGSINQLRKKNTSGSNINKSKKNFSAPPISPPEKVVVGHNTQSAIKISSTRVNKKLKRSIINRKTSHVNNSLSSQPKKNRNYLSKSRIRSNRGRKVISVQSRNLTTTPKKSTTLANTSTNSQKIAGNSVRSKPKSGQVEKSLSSRQNKLSHSKKSLISSSKQQSQLPINQNAQINPSLPNQIATEGKTISNKSVQTNSLRSKQSFNLPTSQKETQKTVNKGNSLSKKTQTVNSQEILKTPLKGQVNQQNQTFLLKPNTSQEPINNLSKSEKKLNENKLQTKPANSHSVINQSVINNVKNPRTNAPPIAQPENINISDHKIKLGIKPNMNDNSQALSPKSSNQAKQNFALGPNSQILPNKDSITIAQSSINENSQIKTSYVEPGQTQILPGRRLNSSENSQSSSQKNPINSSKNSSKSPKKFVSSEDSRFMRTNNIGNQHEKLETLGTSNIKGSAIDNISSEKTSETPTTIKSTNQNSSTISQIQPDQLPTEQIRDLLPPPIRQPVKVQKTLKSLGQDLLKVPPILIPVPPEKNTPIPLFNKQPKPKATRQDMLKAITNTALRYPAIANPTDKLTFDAPLFKPTKDQVYTDIDIRFAENNPVVNKLTIGYFPEKEQFYWALPGNRLVLETKGWQVGSRYRGQSREFEFKQSVSFSQNLWGLQAIWLIPQAPSDLIGNFDPKQVTIQATAGEVINPPGVPTGRVVINSGVNPNDPNVTVLSNSRPPVIGAGTTNNPSGGGALFDNLTPDNTPLLIQGFPTNNLRPLFADGLIPLRRREIIPDEVLNNVGMSWENRDPDKINQLLKPTSNPGIKTLQKGEFDNYDLLNVLANPYLSRSVRDYHYLNSLYWYYMGQRPPLVRVSSSEKNYDWYQLYVSRPHNRILMQYDPLEAKATYSSQFSNPGVSIYHSFDQGDTDQTQSINATIGMGLGVLFMPTYLDDLDDSLDEAKERFDNGERFTPLETQMSPMQRLQINQRLNSALSNANGISGLEQVSGLINFPSKITPEKAQIFQVRVGNYRRAIQFLNIDSRYNRGNTFISQLRTSNRDFGPLKFIGAILPTSETSLTSDNPDVVENVASAAEVVFTTPDGQKYVQSYNSQDQTTIPVPIKTYELAFDRIGLGRIDSTSITANSFSGYLSLPSVEVLWGGSKNNFNYNVSSGVWVNIDADSAFNVSRNELDAKEPTVGVYVKGVINKVISETIVDKNNQPTAFVTKVPLLVVDWNSASNSNNGSSINASYSYSRLSKNYAYSLTGGVSFGQSSNLQTLGFLSGNWSFVPFFQGQLGLNGGWTFNVSGNYSDDSLLLALQGMKRIHPRWSLGAYWQNYREINEGLNSLVKDASYGVLVRHHFIDNSVLLDASFGFADGDFEFRVKGGYRF